MDQIIDTDEIEITEALLEVAAPPMPDYMTRTYAWAYINPLGVALLDHQLVVSAILWGNSKRLKRAALSEFRPGQRVLQAAHVYGDFCPQLARLVGHSGRLDVVDIVPLQVRNCRNKLSGMPQAWVRLADAAAPDGGLYDAVCCYFLLHELPQSHKHAVVDALLEAVTPGGKVVFVDYHKPAARHPLKGIMNFVWRRLEPYARGLLETEIVNLAPSAGRFNWTKETYFGGLYQKVVARRRRT
jgi:SAM-dependent methyltransferase